ncbi:MAG: A/G-specific adenine glycosylase [Anaerolineaceae bacterium]
MRWYRQSGRHTLPWRLTHDPYSVLVSEVMLQQTQVDRVLPYYEAWLERWPTVGSLAEATVADVIRAWGGLGYNRRAVNLHRAATAIQDEGGGFPKGVRELMALPGVGPYTANAIASFAFKQPVAVADTNIARVLARLFHGVASQRELSPAEVIATAQAALPRRTARDHNLALMDLGALICIARQPACNRCPLRSACAWRNGGYQPSLSPPRPNPRFETTARFARGRIVDALRAETSLSTEAVVELLPAAHRPDALRLLTALRLDGVIEQNAEGEWRLPLVTAG